MLAIFTGRFPGGCVGLYSLNGGGSTGGSPILQIFFFLFL